MANPPFNNPGAGLGITPTPDKYPQWGVKQVSSGHGAAADYSVREAANAAQKQAGLRAGYLLWFATPADARAYASGQDSALNGNIPVPQPLQGLAAVGDFFSRLTEANTWIRVLKIIIGGALLLEGLMRMSGAEKTLGTVAKTAAKGALFA